MKKAHLQRCVATVAAAAITFAIFSAVVAVAEHEQNLAVLLAAQINPQTLATNSAPPAQP